MRWIVPSQTYQQSSQASLELLACDPENRLLARGPRYRLLAEMIRDAALLAVGESPRDESLDMAEHAAWTVVANVVLNRDEFLTKE